MTDTPVIRFVDRREAIADELAHVDEPVVGVDVERADSHRYFRKAALVQVGVPGTCVLVDGVEPDDLEPLGAFLAGRVSVFHAIENDLDPLASAAVRPDDVRDTAIAAALLGLPTGLGNLLSEVLGIELTADKDKLQRADWEARPLTDEMREYAAGDVVFLPRLWSELEAQLQAVGRLSWFEQELEATVSRAHEDNRDWERTKGAGRLTPEQRTYLRELWELREEIARETDTAPQRLLRDDILVAFAQDPPSASGEIVRRAGRRRARKHADQFMDAIRRARHLPPTARETNGRRWTDTDRDAYDAMRKARAGLAKEIGLESGVLCPSRPLWSAIVSDPSSPQELCAAAGLRPWQAELLADVLWEAYVKARGNGED